MFKMKQGTRIICLDISSTNTGMVIYANNKISRLTNLTSKAKDYQRIIDQANELEGWLSHTREVGIVNSFEFVVEQPFYSPNKSHDTSIKMTHGALLFSVARWCEGFVIPYIWNDVSLSTWRGFLFKDRKVKPKGTGELKAETISAVKKIFKVEGIDDNIADALGILNWRLNNEQK